MWFFGWLAIGVLAGLAANRIAPHEGPSVDVAFGIVGALVGACLFNHLMVYAPVPAFSLGSVPAAMAGSAIVLALERMLARIRMH